MKAETATTGPGCPEKLKVQGSKSKEKAGINLS
jgi:hypothetical protein